MRYWVSPEHQVCQRQQVESAALNAVQIAELSGRKHLQKG